MEEISEHYISELSIETNLTAITVAATIASAAAAASSAGFSIKVAVESAPGNRVAVGTADASGDGTAAVALIIPDPQLWSPESPFLYNLTVTLLNTVTPTISGGNLDSSNIRAVDEVLSYDRPLSHLQRQRVSSMCTLSLLIVLLVHWRVVFVSDTAECARLRWDRIAAASSHSF